VGGGGCSLPPTSIFLAEQEGRSQAGKEKEEGLEEYETRPGERMQDGESHSRLEVFRTV
jgi:hypothetical protein